MSTFHDFTCPNCKEPLLLEVVDAIGGHVQTAVRAMEQVVSRDQNGNIQDVSYRPTTPLTGTDEAVADTAPSAMPAQPAFPGATAAAVAHAQETGVDINQVEGSGAEGKITKADVAAAAAPDQEPAPDPKTTVTS